MHANDDRTDSTCPQTFPPSAIATPEGADDTRKCLPFLKWAGGKRWLASQHLGLFPAEYDRYIEPFLGGGSVFFALSPPKSILADSNPRLIETYVQIRDNPGRVRELLVDHQAAHSDVYYYKERARRYPQSAVHRAAQLIYLNRTCWNGLYRVNRKGEFNVPRGTKSSVVLDTDDFDAISSLLSTSELHAQDFSKTIARAGSGDFVYVDPPYTVRHKYNGFAKYNERIFSWDDQVRLHKEVVAAIERGALVAISNADHESITQLYQEVGKQTKVSRTSIIAGDAAHRGGVDELLILSWCD